MVHISSARIQDAWERAFHQPPLLRALTLLQLGDPERPLAELSALTIAQRDWLLMRVREQIAGSTFDAISVCPNCNERVEVSFESGDLLPIEPAPAAGIVRIEHNGFTVTVRFPNTEDLLALAQPSGEELLRRCLENSSDAALSPDFVQAIEAGMADADPVTDLQIELSCPQCDRCWSTRFDIAEYLWHELDERARKLFRETHALARFYGWSEAAILSMSNLRRQVYLEMAVEQ